MSFLNKIKPNKPQASLEGYFITMLGKSKFGKTTWVMDVVDEHYDGDMSKALLLATEIGYKTMDGVYALPITGFEWAEDEDNEEEKGFIETVDELIENKSDTSFRFIIIDTITALERYAIAYAIKKANREDRPDKRYVDISDIPWGKGYNLVAEYIYEQIDRLKKAGFGVLVIGHEKTKSTTNKDGFSYDYTGLNVLTKTSDIIERESDFIIYGDLMVTEGEDGKPVESRMLRFRSDGNFLAGCRFRNFPEALSNKPEDFLQAFKDAVVNSSRKSQKVADMNPVDKETAELVETMKENQEKVKEVKVKKEEVVESVEEKQEPTVTADEVKAEIAELLADMETEDKKKCAVVFKKETGAVDYRKSDDVEALQEALEFVKSLA
ncbi:p-loop containing nucleoside triphosphate [Bacillus phage vB_BanS_Nate]|uniref:P-loop containing nucleoside triphosphate n=1 Tax=Bacillus phage vB_BanS_Nate TaxID=2894788 RepID=A0AAE9CEH8_9CAUD|nr:p-loop containing nucleoside triphosphate [Bacillus phage vB_BanS_Nate]UGO50957.1 p-loop containing nucleoside triphosphate [Bacillus phage vB_BanS_Nate]